MWGPVIFTPILWAVTAFVPAHIAEWGQMIYGILLIIILMLRPQGVIDRPLLRSAKNKLKNLRWLGLSNCHRVRE